MAVLVKENDFLVRGEERRRHVEGGKEKWRPAYREYY
jgi:hypothetical protein